MASETLGDSCDDLIARARCRWSENSIVYTRRSRKKAQNLSTNDGTAPPTTTTTENPAPTQTDASSVITAAAPAEVFTAMDVDRAADGSHHAQDSPAAVVTKEKNDDSSKLQEHRPTDADELSHNQAIPENGLQNTKDSSPFSGEKDLQITLVPEGNNDCPVDVNGVVKPLVISTVDDRIRFNLSKSIAKNDIKELKKTLLCELDQVTGLVKHLESKERQIILYNNNTQISNGTLSNSGNYISGFNHPQPNHTRSDVIDRRLMVRVNSEMGQLGQHENRHVGLSRVNSDVGAARNIEPRSYDRQLSVSVMRNEYVEKEKRTPKANQFYRNSEFLLGKDRLPPESNKRLKTNNGRRHRGETEHAFGFGSGKNRNRVFKNCTGLLQRLIKHDYGWVFNEPVDAKALGLVDYHDVIKHPMDLGTIKSRLSRNSYKSPRDFAEDVRLVFRNAMTYNPKGQDVHVMAENLLQIFEEKWATIEAEYYSNWKNQMYPDPPRSHFDPSSAPISMYAPPAPQTRAFDRPEPVVAPAAIDPKIQLPHVGRTPAPKKPKAKDLDKRDMTYEEKQKLSTNLQDLPPEKLDAIVQIIKRRNTALSQNDDEIEVDIDSVDAETLWELDRFVTNYRKSLSKNKRKAELALQARTVSNQNIAPMNSVPAVSGQIGSGAAFEKGTDPPAENEKRAYNGSRSSSSSSSSSDSGSSSSDSDSDSSSADGSDAGHSPKS